MEDRVRVISVQLMQKQNDFEAEQVMVSCQGIVGLSFRVPREQSPIPGETFKVTIEKEVTQADLGPRIGAVEVTAQPRGGRSPDNRA